jgi:putative endonuclease
MPRIKKAAPPKLPAAPERVAAFNTGITAEACAESFLTERGYRVLARRFKTRYGEIDIVAQTGTLLAFVEVKARARIDDAAYAVTPRQQQRIVDAARGWLMTHPEHAAFDLRFDALLIAPRQPPCHLMAAFDAGA